MADLIPRYIESPKFPIKPALSRILVYIGMAVLIWLLGLLTPGVPDEIVAEIVWIAWIAFSEIRNMIKASKDQKELDKK